jgi:hypothetical protein
MPSGWSDSSTERFSGWDIIPTQVPKRILAAYLMKVAFFRGLSEFVMPINVPLSWKPYPARD